jgi:aspartyl-tRNA(Asn)/glutamyl-tRNA(Gln) amidotransferase subunit A
MSEMVRWTIMEAADKIRSRSVSPVELTDACLSAIERIDSRLKSFITVTGDLALKQARTAEKEIAGGLYKGPLHGVPIAVKDIIDTAGVRTTGGSKVMADNVPAADARVWQQLREAGGLLIGKTNLHEFARGSTTDNPHYGRCRNPWDIDGSRIAGGSSGGSGAAVAACLCAGALGTDTLGSVRKPSSRCGIVGIKPTYNLVSRAGVIPLSWSLDNVGPMTRTVSDTAAMLSCMVDPSMKERLANAGPFLSESFSIKGKRLGLINGWWDARCDVEVRAAFETARDVLSDLGAGIHEVDFPHMARFFAAGRVLAIGEATAVHYARLRRGLKHYGKDVRNALLSGFTVSAKDYLHCLRVRAWGIRQVRELFSRIDAIVCPSTAEPAMKIEEVQGPASLDMAFYTAPAAFLGIPAISVPCGFSSYGIPIGLQIIAPHFKDDLAIHIAAAYESATDWHRMRPPVCDRRERNP